MTLFRQPSPGNWEAVIGQVLAELMVFVNTAQRRKRLQTQDTSIKTQDSTAGNDEN
jgi:hypothetical protein